MTDEELNRKFEFIAGVLANLTVSQQKAEERMNRADERTTRLERTLLLAIRAGRRERREWREHYGALVDAHMRIEEMLARAQARNEEAFARLAESQAQSNRKLDTLIGLVREGKSGENAHPRQDGAHGKNPEDETE